MWSKNEGQKVLVHNMTVIYDSDILTEEKKTPYLKVLLQNLPKSDGPWL